MLHMVTRHGYTDCMKVLLRNGANADCIDSKRKNALHIAAAAGNLEGLKLLIEHGAELNKRDKYGRGGLHWATIFNHVECVKELIRANAEIVCEGNWQPLHEAAKAGHNEIVQVLVDAGCDVKNPSKFPGPRRPWSPLHVACRQGNLETVKLLISLGANINTVNAGGHTPLHEAAYRGFEKILIELLKNGAKCNAISNQRRTPLHEACIQGNVKVAAFLLDAGSNIHAQDVVMNTSLHYVVSANYGKDIKLQLLNMLLSYGADCLMLGKDDDTAIDAAYANFFTEGIEIMKESLETPRLLALQCKIVIRKRMFKRMQDIHLLNLPSPLIKYVIEIEGTNL
ncbi:ankyrin repeat and SOCS box protein 13-like isoform X2 [Xenia sp. Carnegie-2017]|nr:ankyrin repeat and SOCS box protein 13-like isoform X2 [Xenia sp. Carnegie-2017]